MNSDSIALKNSEVLSNVIAGHRNWLALFAGTMLITMQFTGCETADGPVRISVSGKVTLDQAPLRTGVIRFIPVDEIGGPAASTKVVDGEFEFSSQNGPLIANHRVEIEATDFHGFAIDDEAAFAAAAERSRKSPVAVNPVPIIYIYRSTLTASVTDADGQTFAFDLKTEQ